MPDFIRKHNDSLTWVFRALVGLMLVAQLWLTSNFVTKAEYEKNRADVTETLDAFRKDQSNTRSDLQKLPTRSDLEKMQVDVTRHDLRISNLERFEQEAGKKTGATDNLLQTLQRDMMEISKQGLATATLLGAYREDLRDVSKKMDMLLQQQAAKPRHPSDQ